VNARSRDRCSYHYRLRRPLLRAALTIASSMQTEMQSMVRPRLMVIGLLLSWRSSLSLAGWRVAAEGVFSVEVGHVVVIASPAIESTTDRYVIRRQPTITSGPTKKEQTK
jgi:hypothetical protein